MLGDGLAAWPILRPRKESHDDATWLREMSRASDWKTQFVRAVPNSNSGQHDLAKLRAKMIKMRPFAFSGGLC